MNVMMSAEHTIYAAIETLLSLVAPEKAILTTVTIRVTSKTDYSRSKARHLHFLFERTRGTYIAVYWASPEKSIFPSEVHSWVRSACNDGVQVVGGQGIGGPIKYVVGELLNELGGRDNCQDYEAEASWLLGQPKVVKLKRAVKLSTEQFDFRYKILIEE